MEKTRTNSDIVFSKLKDMILVGNLDYGDRLPTEQKLCELFSVSRTTLRSALSRLSALGYTESRHGSGTYVRYDRHCITFDSIKSYPIHSIKDTLSMFEFRKIIEVESAILSANRATPEEMDAMEQSIDRMKKARDDEEITKADMDFHMLIVRSTQNPILLQLYDTMYDYYTSFLMDNVRLLGAQGSVGHADVLAAIRIRDGERAGDLMRKHLNDSMNSFLLKKDSEGLNIG